MLTPAWMQRERTQDGGGIEPQRERERKRERERERAGGGGGGGTIF
jgi:hypothetical protein